MKTSDCTRKLYYSVISWYRALRHWRRLGYVTTIPDITLAMWHWWEDNSVYTLNDMIDLAERRIQA